MPASSSPPPDARPPRSYAFPDGREVVMRAPYASIARSMFLEAMWPTRKAMPSRSTSLIMVHSVTRRSAYSGVISCGGFILVRLPLSALDASGSPQVGPGRTERDGGRRRVERGRLAAADRHRPRDNSKKRERKGEPNLSRFVSRTY